MAILPPAERPPPEDVLAPGVARAAEPDVLAEDVDGLAIRVTVSDGNLCPLCVDVTRTVWGPVFVAVLPGSVLSWMVVTTLTTVGDPVLCSGGCGETIVGGESPSTVIVGGCDAIETKVDVAATVAVSAAAPEVTGRTVCGGPETKTPNHHRQQFE